MQILHRKKEKNQPDSGVQENLPKSKPKHIPVQKVEVVNDNVKFSMAKGFFKKRWIVVKEIPVLEITRIENFGNELAVTWKDKVDTFFMKGKSESFGRLCDKVNEILEQRESQVSNEISTQRRNELLGVINASVGVVDLSFNILIDLQAKRVNWKQLEIYSNGFGESLSFSGHTMSPLNLDFTKISSSIERQVPREASREAYNILKAIYAYFDGLSVDDDLKDYHPNLQNAKALILAYYILNDLFLGRVVGDKENDKENSQFETVLQILANETTFKINVDELRGTINNVDLEKDRESVIEASRELFKQQLRQL
jgi:hypothetical protein